MTITEFTDRLVAALNSAPVPRQIANEQDFETRFVIPVTLETAARETNLHIYTHPWGKKTHCTPDCQTARTDGKVEIGCPQCWKESKKWASVAAFGTLHNFDLAARDSSGQTLAIEIKLVDATRGRMPNGDIQRFIGQCTLAKTKHASVIGICGYRGSLKKWDHDTVNAIQWFDRSGICLVFRSID